MVGRGSGRRRAPGKAVPGDVGADGDEEHVAAALHDPLLDLAQVQPHACAAVAPRLGHCSMIALCASSLIF